MIEVFCTIIIKKPYPNFSEGEGSARLKFYLFNYLITGQAMSPRKKLRNVYAVPDCLFEEIAFTVMT